MAEYSEPKEPKLLWTYPLKNFTSTTVSTGMQDHARGERRRSTQKNGIDNNHKSLDKKEWEYYQVQWEDM